MTRGTLLQGRTLKGPGSPLLPSSVAFVSSGDVRPSAYGAKGDGVILYQASMTSGSAVLTSSDANFTSADVGKAIIVSGVQTNAGTLSTTIASVQSATQCTLAASCTGGTIDPAGARIVVYGTDDTAAIQAASDAAAASNSGTVLFDSKVYVIAGALTQGGSRKSNSQLTLPNGGQTGNVGRLVWKGSRDYSGLNGGGTPYPGAGGTTLVSTLVGQTYSPTYGIPSVIGGPTLEQAGNAYSGWLFSCEDLCVLTHRSPSLTAFNLERCSAQNRRRVTAGTLEWGIDANYSDNVSGFTQPSNPWACAFIDPTGGNMMGGAGRSDEMCTWGYFAGFTPGEHSNVTSYQVFGTKIPIAVDTRTSFRTEFAHACMINYMTCQGNPYVISGWDPTAAGSSFGNTGAGIVAIPAPSTANRFPIVVGNLDLEDFSDIALGNNSWTVLAYHINDPNNHLNGRIGFTRYTWASSSFNDSNTLVVNGASRVLLQPNNVGPPQNLGQGALDAIMPWTITLTPSLGGQDAALKVGTWANNVDTGSLYNGWLFNSTNAQNDEIGWDLLLANGTWNLSILFKKNAFYAIYTVLLDGVSIGTIDSYASVATANQLGAISGFTVSTPGKHRLVVQAATRNASSTGWTLALQQIQLRRTA